MHEDLFLNLLDQYRNKDLSLDRVIVDSRFKSLPLADKVDLLKTHGHTIHQGSKTDKKFWKDIAAGAAGTAIMLAEPAMAAISDLKKADEYGVKWRHAYDAGESFNEPVPDIKLAPYKSLAVSAFGAGIAAPKFYEALKARKNMQMVKRLLNEQPGSNTQENAINVIARS